MARRDRGRSGGGRAPPGGEGTALGVRVEELHLSEDDERWSISVRLRVPPQTAPAEIVQTMTSEPHIRHVEWAGG